MRHMSQPVYHGRTGEPIVTDPVDPIASQARLYLNEALDTQAPIYLNFSKENWHLAAAIVNKVHDWGYNASLHMEDPSSIRLSIRRFVSSHKPDHERKVVKRKVVARQCPQDQLIAVEMCASRKKANVVDEKLDAKSERSLCACVIH